PVSAGSPIRITVDNQSSTQATQVYVRFGQMASAAVYEVRDTSPSAADQTVLIPLARPGDYYLMVKNDSPSWQPTPLTVRLLAEPLTFKVLGSSPAEVGNAGKSTLLVEGALFDSTTAFSL